MRSKTLATLAAIAAKPMTPNDFGARNAQHQHVVGCRYEQPADTQHDRRGVGSLFYLRVREEAEIIAPFVVGGSEGSLMSASVGQT